MNIYIRTNFNNSIGLGHIKRTIRIAKEMKKRGHNCIFYLDKFYSKVKVPFKSIEIYSKNKTYYNETEDAKLFAKSIKNKTPGIVILDDYRFSKIWEKLVSSICHKIVVIDDLENKKHYADFIINYNPRNYPIVKYNFKNNKKNDCQFLIHPKYNIISKKKIKTPSHSKIFNITIYIGGGSDQKILYELTKEILKNIEGKKIKLIIVIGVLTKNYNQILKLSKKNKQLKYILKPENLSSVIKNSKIFIGSSGTSIFETAFYKTPSILIKMSKNQDSNIFSLEKLGHYFFINKKEFLSSNKFSKFIILIYENYNRFRIFNKKPEIKIDNRGSNRILDKIFSKNKKDSLNLSKINERSNSEILKVRAVRDKDINHYLHSRNLEINRNNSVNKKKISNLEHYSWWFRTKRKSQVLLKGQEKILYFYEEKIFKHKSKNYSISGWFACSKKCSIKEILFALNWQRKNTKHNVKWISFVKKSNKMSVLMSKYIGWIKIDVKDELTDKLNSELKISKNDYIFYKR